MSIVPSEKTRSGSRRRLLLVALAITASVQALASTTAKAGGSPQTLYLLTGDLRPKNGYAIRLILSQNEESGTAYMSIDLKREAVTDFGAMAAAPTTQHQTHRYSFTLPASDVVIASDLKSVSIDTKDHMGEWGAVKLK